MTDTQKDKENQKDNSLTTYKYDPAFFHADYNLYILYRRIDNVAAALFLLTNDFPDDEPMKQSLRLTALACLKKVMGFITSPKVEVALLQSLWGEILELGSLLNISFWSELINEMNASILQREVLKIQDTLSEIFSTQKNKLLIDTTLFTRVDLDAQHYKNTFQASSVFNKKADRDYKGQISIGQDKGHIKDSIPRDSESRAERRQAILDLLATKSNLNIKDFVGVIPRFSEKTIQRELLSLVEDGVVKKEGERRWSTYSLVN